MMNRINSLSEESSSPSLSVEDVRALVRLAPMIMLVIALGGCKADPKLAACQIETAKIEGILKGVGIEFEQGETGNLQECLVANERIKGVMRGAAMKSDEIKVKLEALDIVDVSFSIPAGKSHPELSEDDSRPTPRIVNDPLCERWTKIQKTSRGGYTFYKMPARWPKNISDLDRQYPGNWVPEPVYWMGLYDEQMRVLDKQIASIQDEKRVFEDEINRIERHLSGAKISREQTEGENAEIVDEIEEMAEKIRQLRARGVPPTSIEIQVLQYELRRRQQQLYDAAPSNSQEQVHMADWPVAPGSTTTSRQNLYLLIRKYKSEIKIIEETEETRVKSLQEERDLNDYWSKKWLAIWNDKYQK